MAAIDKFREMLQRGEYDIALKQESLLKDLWELVKPATIHDEDCLDAAAILAELYDQTSLYAKAAATIEFDRGTARHVLQSLQEDTRVEKDNQAQDIERVSSTRKKLRAKALFCLAHAISLHRITGDRGQSLDKAIVLAKSVSECLGDLSRVGYHFQGAQSFTFYWLGRFYVLKDRPREAEQMFSKSIHFQQSNLDFHLEEHFSKDQTHNGDSPRFCRRCQSQVSLTNYLLASNMAFGLASIKLKTGKVTEALALLRPAIILLEGSTSDRYRKGYARLLTGTAHRVHGGANARNMRRAIGILDKAKELFGSQRQSEAAHLYYAARASYQLSLANLFIVMDTQATFDHRTDALLVAVEHYCDVASSEVMREADDESEADKFADLNLRVRLRLLASSLVCELIKLFSNQPDQPVLKVIRTQLSGISAVERFSKFLASIQNTGAKDSGVESIFHKLASEAKENIRLAKKDEVRLRGDHIRIPNIILAEANLVSVQYERFIKAAHSDVKGEHPKTVASRREQAKDDLVRLKADLESLIPSLSESNCRSLAGAHVALARILFLEGNRVAARRRLETGWRPLRDRVENQIIHDEAESLLARMPAQEDEVTLTLVEEGRNLDGKAITKQFYRKLVQGLNEQGLSEDAAAKKRGVDVKTIRSWCKRGGYTWVRAHD